jgi:hypothetical protein
VEPIHRYFVCNTALHLITLTDTIAEELAIIATPFSIEVTGRIVEKIEDKILYKWKY